ncbi:MAG: DUF6164 family protein [Mariprofundaceae bacterium]|nr:DUF6164 family protein [Mariprofundaceae bacterium]
MAELLFRLRYVPDEESNAIRELLVDANIDTYETTVGSWGLGMAAIWLHNDAQSATAHALLDAYQEQRKQTPLPPPVSHWQHWLSHPWQTLLFCLLIGFVLFVTLSPFLFSF